MNVRSCKLANLPSQKSFRCADNGGMSVFPCQSDMNEGILKYAFIVYRAYCPKFGQLILRKIIRIVATRCPLLVQNAHNSISAGAPPQTPLG